MACYDVFVMLVNLFTEHALHFLKKKIRGFLHTFINVFYIPIFEQIA